MHGDWWHGGWMWLGWILILVAIAVLAWALASASRRREPGGESAESILKKRYAAGEIDRETYERTLEDLRR